MVAPREKLTPRGRTQRTDKVAIKPRPRLRQRINVRRFEISVPIDRIIPPPRIIRQHHHHIRRCRMELGANNEREEETKSVDHGPPGNAATGGMLSAGCHALLNGS